MMAEQKAARKACTSAVHWADKWEQTKAVQMAACWGGCSVVLTVLQMADPMAEMKEQQWVASWAAYSAELWAGVMAAPRAVHWAARTAALLAGS